VIDGVLDHDLARFSLVSPRHDALSARSARRSETVWRTLCGMAQGGLVVASPRL